MNNYVYRFEEKTYINLTNRCNNACDFCVRNHAEGIAEDPLWLDREPNGQDVIAMLKAQEEVSEEVVFCGFGEPTMNLDALLETAKYLKSIGRKNRLNTNGLGNVQHQRNIIPELAEVIDSVSISLNEATAEKYDAVCHSDFGLDAFGEMLKFAENCVKAGIETKLSVVDVISREDIERCREIAKEIGAELRVRAYIE